MESDNNRNISKRSELIPFRDGFMREYYTVIPSDLTEGTSIEAKKWGGLFP